MSLEIPFLITLGLLGAISCVILVKTLISFFQQKQVGSISSVGISLPISYLSLGLLPLVQRILPVDMQTVMVCSIVFWSSILFSIGVTIVVLSNSTSDTSTHKLALTGLILSISLLIVSPVIPAYDVLHHKPGFDISLQPHDSAKQKEYRYDEFNIRFHMPEGPWLEYNLKQSNPATLEGFMRANPVVFLQIIAEININIPPGQDRIFAEQVYGHMMASAQQHKVISQENYAIDDIPGVLIQAEFVIQHEKVIRYMWLGGINGYYYQINFWAPAASGFEPLQEAFKQFEKTFERLDRESSPMKRPDAKEYHSKDYFYKVPPVNGWSQARFSEDSSGLEALGIVDYYRSYDQNKFLLIYPYYFWNLPPDLEAFTASVLKLSKIVYEEVPKSDIVAIEENGMKGYRIKHARVENDKKLYYSIKILLGKKVGYYLSAFEMELAGPIQRELLDEAIDLVVFEEQGKLPKPSSLEGKALVRHIDMLTAIAQYYEYHGDTFKSMDFYEKAYELDQSNKDRLMDILNAYSYQDSYLEGISFLKRQKNEMLEDIDIRIWYAYLLYRADELVDSAKEYEAILEMNDVPDYVIADYYFLKKEMNSAGDGVSKLRTLVEEKFSLENQIYTADLIKKSFPEESLSIYEKLYNEYPQNTEVRSGYLFGLGNHGKFEKVLEVVSKHIEEYGGAADLYWHEGFILTGLKQYDKAKVAFHKIRNYIPDTGSDQYGDFLNGFEFIQRQESGQEVYWSEVEVKRDMSMNDENLIVKGEIILKGQWADRWRDMILEHEFESLEKWFEVALKNTFLKVNVNAVSILNLRTFEKPLVINYNYEAENVFTRLDNGQLFGWLPIVIENSFFWQESTEQNEYPVVILFPGRVISETVFHYPVENKVQHSLVSNKDLEGVCSRFKNDVQVSPGTLKINNDFKLLGIGIPLAEFDSCREEINGKINRNTPRLIVA